MDVRDYLIVGLTINSRGDKTLNKGIGVTDIKFLYLCIDRFSDGLDGKGFHFINLMQRELCMWKVCGVKYKNRRVLKQVWYSESLLPFLCLNNLSTSCGLVQDENLSISVSFVSKLT